TGVRFGLLALRQVTGDLEEAPDSPALVTQGGNDDVGPKPRPVLPDPPALVLEPALGSRPLQLLGGPAPLAPPWRGEAGARPAHALFGPVAVDALGPGVPGGDDALPVEQEDGVIPHPGHQLLEVFFALPPPPLDPALSGGRRPHGPVAGRWACPPSEQPSQELKHGAPLLGRYR